MESGKVTPGNLPTLRALTDPDRRPQVPRDPHPEAFLNMVLEIPFRRTLTDS